MSLGDSSLPIRELEIMTPVVDRGIIVFFAGLVLGYLEMSGVADPTQHTENLDALSNVIGGIITVATIISYFLHRTAVMKHEIEYGDTVDPKGVQPKYAGQTFLTKLSSFILKEKTIIEPGIQSPNQSLEIGVEGQ